ncbi:MAG: hypothetical protein U5K69_26210 [Balneolaceae bacterium]|nr:hypothetical protein [Balneolaceae bacterium]
MDRKQFLQSAAASAFLFSTGLSQEFANELNPQPANSIITTTGAISPDKMGTTLVHEHILSRFGPPAQEPGQYNEQQVLKEVVPYLKYIRSLGCDTIVDCTAAFFGRNAALSRKQSPSKAACQLSHQHR